MDIQRITNSLQIIIHTINQSNTDNMFYLQAWQDESTLLGNWFQA